MGEMCRSRWPIFWIKKKLISLENYVFFLTKKPEKTYAYTWYLMFRNAHNSASLFSLPFHSNCLISREELAGTFHDIWREIWRQSQRFFLFKKIQNAWNNSWIPVVAGQFVIFNSRSFCSICSFRNLTIET